MLGAVFQPMSANGRRTAIEIPVRMMTSSRDIRSVIGS